MKSKLKWISGILGAVLVLSLVFGAGVYASQWLNFTGDEQVEQSQNNVDEIMDILRQVNDGKITAEEAELRLKGEVTQLTEDNGSLQDDIEYLEDLLEDIAGDTPGQKINKLKEANDNLRIQKAQLETDLTNETNKNEELQTSITGLQEDKKKLQGTIELRDNEIVGLKEQLANAPEDQTEYVAHLEEELERANSLVETHHEATSEAVEEARTYQE